jgi:hypothetical protein
VQSTPVTLFLPFFPIPRVIQRLLSPTMTRFGGVTGFEFPLKPIIIRDLIPTLLSNAQSILSVPNTSPLPQTDHERGSPSLIPIKTPLPLNSLPSSPSFSVSHIFVFLAHRPPRLTSNPLNSLYTATKMALTTLNLGVVDFDDPTPVSEQPRDTGKREFSWGVPPRLILKSRKRS